MSAQNFSYIDRALHNAFENGATPGIALLVDHHGQCVYRNTLGYAQVYPEHRDLHDDTIFDLASLTKVIATTTAVMLLVRDKQVNLHDPVKKYVPELRHEQITFLHLLTHSAGFPDHCPLYEEVQQEADRRQDESFIGSPEAKKLVIEKICQTELIYAPGQFSKYSDLGIILLGHTIERISDASLDAYCNDMIFRPFGMANTFFQPGNVIRPGDYAATERCEWRHRVICGQVHDENAYAMGGVAGHAGLFATIDDVHRCMLKLFHCYNGEDETIPKPLIRQFFARQNVVAGSTRALGWDTPSKGTFSGGTLLSEKSIGHTGFSGTSIWFDLTRKLLMLLFSNRVHPSRNNHTFIHMRPKIHDTIVIAIDNTL